MPRSFRVRYLVPGGSAVGEEVLRGESAEELRLRVSASGRAVLAVRPEGSLSNVLSASADRRARFDVGWWCHEVQTLLRAGMSPVEALETVAAGSAEQGDGGERRRVHDALLASLRAGAALSRAMRETGAFPEVLLAGVTASERTSKLADALAEYLQYDAMLQRLRRQVVSAALYPALVVGLGGAIAAFLLLYVVPRFSRMYGSFHGALSLPTELVLGLSGLMREHGAAVAVGMGLALVAGLLAIRSGAALRAVLGVMQSCAPLRRPLDDFRRAQLYQALAMLVRGGYTFDEALGVVAGASLGDEMQGRVRSAREQVARGRSASAALSAAGLTDLVAARLLSVGERGGGFAAILLTIAERYAASFATFVERATRLVEPLLLLTVALLVGALVVMMYLPIFEIAGGLGAAP